MLFKDLYIGQHLTVEASKYMVLNFDFSGIDTSTLDSTYKGFLKNVRDGASLFMTTYTDFFTDEQALAVDNETSPEDVIN